MEDFEEFDRQHGQQAQLGEHRKPQDTIYNMIKDNMMSEFDEMDELERRLKYMQEQPWQEDICEDFYHEYVQQRPQIVQSGLTIWDLRQLYQSEDMSVVGTPLNAYLKEKNAKHMFAWELLDQIFGELKNRKKEQESCKGPSMVFCQDPQQIDKCTFIL